MFFKSILIALLFSIISINCEKIIKDPKNFLSDVIIDTNGDFKYILIEMANKTNLNDYKYLIRGSNEFDYHKCLFLNFMQKSVYKFPEMYQNYSFKVLGGGRIAFQGNDIVIYGESGVYGKANHKLTGNLLKKKFPSFNIKCF